MIPLSVLDLSPVTTATPGSTALHNSLDLARLADSLGYKRYWLAEHHNLANIASSSGSHNSSAPTVSSNRAVNGR